MFLKKTLYPFCVILLLFININVSAQLNFNVTRTFVPLKPFANEADVISGARTNSEIVQSTQYIDGYGRTVQSVVKQASPLQKDMVEYHIYNVNTGREERTYLPFVSNVATAGDITDDGNYKADAAQQQTTFCQNQFPGESYFYGQTVYENSPLNRVMNTYPQGNSWVGVSKGTTIQYLSNTTIDNVQKWNISGVQGSTPTDAGAYAAGQLYKSISSDEKGLQVISFKDLEGHVVLKKVQLSAATVDNGSGSGHLNWLCTYYVYDDFGNLRFVITPKVVTQIDGSWIISQPMADELCYRYEYDLLNRSIIKKNPGAGEEWFIYDQRNRLVMSQDANLRSPGQQKWKYYQYDLLDRLISTGLLTDPVNYNNLATHQNAAASSITYPNIGSYTTEILSQTFYDNYSWVSSTLSGIGSSLDQSNTSNTNYFLASSNAVFPYPQAISQTVMTRGLTTGSKIEVLGSNGSQYLYTVSFFDDHGHIIQTQGTNITGGIDKATTQYSWNGKALRILEQETKNSSNPQTHVILTKMNYDFGGRVTNVTKTINSSINGVAINGNEKTIATYSYNELGQINNKNLGADLSTGAALETLAYDYNIRGWLTGINKNFTQASSTSNYFGMEIGYDKTTTTNATTSFTNPVYNGSIGGLLWKSKGDGVPRKYDFTYDNANQLSSASFNQNTAIYGSIWDKAYMDFSINNISYDANGNIKALNQNGFVLGGSQNIDDLNYNYKNVGEISNQLMNVVDNAPNNAQSTLGDFHYSGTKTPGSTVDYSYDNNGNLISDANKNISSITYNALNLPSVLNVTGKGTISYIYDAAGIKLKKISQETGATVSYNNISYLTDVTTTTIYIGGLVYQSKSYSNPTLNTPLGYTEILQTVSHEEGRARIVTLPSGQQGYAYDFFVKDHLGNVRVVITDEQRTNVYLATMEPSIAGFEESLFANLPATRSTITPAMVDANHTSGSSAALTNFNTNKIGPAIVLKVMAGDNLNIKTDYYYQNNSGNNNNVGALAVSDLIMNLASGVMSQGVSKAGVTNLQSTASPLNNTASSFINGRSYTGGPKAYINYIFFDDQFKYVSGNAISINSSLANSWQTLNVNPSPLTASKSGYVYVFVSNESNYNIYFDNLQINHTQGQLLEEKHFYPTGLTMAALTSRAFSPLTNGGAGRLNALGYQGKEMQNGEFADGSGLEEYDFEARYYDPQLARWHNQDPAGQFASPYLAMGNSWVNGIDPSGKWFGIDDAIAAGFGAIVNLGAQLASGNVHGIGDAFGYLLTGAASGEAGLYGGPLAAGAILGAGNSITGQLANGTSLGNLNYSAIAFSATIGGLSSSVGTAISQVVSPYVNNILGEIGSSLVFQRAITGAVTGAVTGGIVSGTISGLQGGNFWEGFGNGASTGAIGGAIGGAASGLKEARGRNINPWTSKPNSTPPSGEGYVKITIFGRIQDDNGKMINVNQTEMWVKDKTDPGSTSTNLQVWGKTPQEVYDILTNYKGGSVNGVSTIGFNGILGQRIQYYLTPKNWPGPTISFQINGFEYYKFRF